MSESLLRQRRNLIATCILLWLLRFGGVSFTKLSLAGFDIEFARPHVLTLSIWIAYAYFLYRYYLYFVDEGVSKLEAAFINSLDQKCAAEVIRIVKAKHPDYYEGIKHSYSSLRHNKWIFKAETYVRTPTGIAAKTEPFALRISPWQLSRPMALAVLSTTFRNSVVTDYLLPFALALFILWYCGSAEWSGSFLSILLPP